MNSICNKCTGMGEGEMVQLYYLDRTQYKTITGRMMAQNAKGLTFDPNDIKKASIFFICRKCMIKEKLRQSCIIMGIFSVFYLLFLLVFGFSFENIPVYILFIINMVFLLTILMTPLKKFAPMVAARYNKRFDPDNFYFGEHLKKRIEKLLSGKGIMAPPDNKP